MTKAEEKAKELIEKFKNLKVTITAPDKDDPNHPYVFTANMLSKNAKACALICVDEILNSEPMFPYEGGGYHELWTDRQEESNNFWQQVKQFINNPEGE